MNRYLCLFAFLFVTSPLLAADSAVGPKLTKRVDAEFTFPLKLAFSSEAAKNGTAKIEFVVTTRGTVEEAKIISAAHREMGPPAQAAVKKWKFKPAIVNGKIIPALMQVELWFGLVDKPGEKGPIFDPILIAFLPDWTDSTKKVK